jgi:hypothetical protein
MSAEISEILIECRGCNVENVFNDYTPDMFLVCNQCRERLVEPDFCDIYKQYTCKDCNFTVFVRDSSEFKVGESACRCDSTNFEMVDPKSFYKNVENAIGFDPDDDISDDDDWYRSEPIETEDDSYDDLFDNDPSSN